jgi:hypothetical protein
MSILLSVATPYCATQVSDMQVTAFAGGQPLSQSQRKSVVYCGDRVRCLVGWVGLAMIEKHNTGDWLHGQLDAVVPDDPPLGDFVNRMTNSATLHFATLNASDKRCEFSLVGWFSVGQDRYAPFSATISNYEVRPWEMSSSYGPKFHYQIAVQTRPSKHPYVLSVAGYERAIREMPLYFRGLRGLLKRRVEVGVISSDCRQVAAAIAAMQTKKRAANPRFTKTVGDAQLTVEMDVSSSANTFSSKDGVVTHGFPADVVYPVVTTKDMQVDRAVDADGTIRLHIRGWIKVNRPNVLMGVPHPPGQ